MKASRDPLTHRAQDYLDTFASGHGARVLEDLRRAFGAHAFAPGDTERTFLNLGAQLVLERISIEMDRARGLRKQEA